MSDLRPQDNSHPEPITEVSVTEVSVETTGVLSGRRAQRDRLLWSASALWMGVVSLLLAPLFGVGVVPAVLAIIVGHIAKHREPRGIVRSGIGLGLSYLALVVGTAVAIFVTLPIALAFLTSAGYILAD
jgi:hypothetical protein